MKLHSLTPVIALGALVSLAACSSAPKPAPRDGTRPRPLPRRRAPMASDPATNQASHSLVMQVQTELKSNHLYSSRIDGAWGPRTMRGVAKFQKMHQMPATGMLDDATLKGMNLQAAPAGTSMPMSGSGSSMPSTDSSMAPAQGDSTAPDGQP